MSLRIISKFEAVFLPILVLPLASHVVIALSTLCDMFSDSLINLSRRLSCISVPFCTVFGVD